MPALSPQFRDLLIRTIIGESAGEGPQGWNAVANVIKNRIYSNAWGDPYGQGSGTRVLTAPKQFAGGPSTSRMARETSANSPLYQRVGQITDAVFGDTPQADPTGGATHFYAPGVVAQPSWAAGANGQRIGNQIFMKLPLTADNTAGTILQPTSAPVGQPGPVRFSVGPKAVADGVDPTLLATVRAATQYLPPGWSAQLTSGYRAGDPRFHGQGKALDIQLIDPNGKPLENYQNEANFRTYEQFAQTVHALQPAGSTPIRWGGYFSGKNGPGGVYGATDLMHFDIGAVPMGGGTWEGGLTAAQRALIPNAVSQGIAQPTAAPPPSGGDPRGPDVAMNRQTGMVAAPAPLAPQPTPAMIPPPASANAPSAQATPVSAVAPPPSRFGMVSMMGANPSQQRTVTALNLSGGGAPFAIPPGGGGNLAPKITPDQTANAAPLPPVKPPDVAARQGMPWPRNEPGEAAPGSAPTAQGMPWPRNEVGETAPGTAPASAAALIANPPTPPPRPSAPTVALARTQGSGHIPIIDSTQSGPTDWLTALVRNLSTIGHSGMGYPAVNLLPPEAQGTPDEVSGRVSYNQIPQRTFPGANPNMGYPAIGAAPTLPFDFLTRLFGGQTHAGA
ncbi:MAG TPA: cell wall hydrolase [Stellaceae bacterium]|jgi:hypothetical protein